ncbi:MAG: AAA family ATPase [Dehalococcoidia bacterium]
MINRVHILGASGSGTTTLGRAMAQQLRCPSFDTDDYYWLPSDPPFRDKRSVPERHALLGEALARHERWVLSGSLCGWGDIFIPQFDLVVFLWVPPNLRLARLRERERRRYGDAALAPGGAMHETYEAFMAWAAAYDDGDLTIRSRKLQEDWLRRLPCPVLRLEGDESIEQRLAQLVPACT